MNAENIYLLREWDVIRINILKGMKRLGHDIKLIRSEYEEPEKRETDFKIGNVVTWKARGNEPEEKGIILCVIPSGESAYEKLPKDTKKCRMHFKDKSIYERALVAVPARNFRQETDYYAPRLNALKKENGG